MKFVKSNWAFLLIVLIGVIVKISFLINHFTHEDDIIVAKSIIKENEIIINYLTEHMGKFLPGIEYIVFPFILMLNFVVFPLVSMFFMQWTYAPLQFCVTSMMVNMYMPYEWNIIMARMPSFLMGICGAFLLYKILLDEFRNKYLSILGISLYMCSWEITIYSSQAEPYVIGVFMMLLLIFIARDESRLFFWLRTRVVMFSAIMACICYAQYHLIVIVGIFFLAVILRSYNDKSQIKNVFRSMGFTALFCFPLMASICVGLFLRGNNLLSRGLNWNVGINGQFTYIPQYNDFYGLISYFVYYISNNFFLCFKYFLTTKSDFIATILVFFAILGYVYINSKLRVQSLFINGSFLAFLLLVICGKFVLGPSRHSMVLIPLMIYLVINGIYVLKLLSTKVLESVCVLMSISLIIMLIGAFSTELELRQNYQNRDAYNDLIDRFTPKVIVNLPRVYDSTIIDLNGYHQNDDDQFGINIKNKDNVEKDDVIVFIGRSYIPSYNVLNNSIDRINKASNSNLSLSDLTLIEKYEYLNGTEVEYASEYYDNYPNGKIYYVYKVK